MPPNNWQPFCASASYGGLRLTSCGPIWPPCWRVKHHRLFVLKRPDWGQLSAAPKNLASWHCCAPRPGVTNREIAAAASAAMLKAGCEEVSLQVVSGPGVAYMGTGNWVLDPWRTLQAGDMLLVDMGILYHGYLGDQTRTAIVGTGTDEQWAIIETIQSAYRQTVAAMRPGALAQDLYQITVDLLAERGWREYFPHHISHGLGLGGDLPRVNATSDDVLQVGDVLSCEPGVYIPGLGGARFENMLYIGESGAEELTHAPVNPPVG
jgi:Xaa-Pro aminopeptidase